MSQGSLQPDAGTVPRGRGTPHRVVLVVDEGSNPFEMACACEVFGARRAQDLGFEPYTLRIVAPGRRTTMRDGLFRITADGDLSALATADTVIVPNRPDVETASRPAVLRAIREAHDRGARMVGLCTGAYTLAEAGLLSGRPAAVHWQLADDFRARFPDVDLRPDVLFVDDGDVLTSAGSAAALDLGLHIVRNDHGAEVANQVSRRLVFAAFRDGGQRQFVERSVPRVTHTPLSATLDWAEEHLAEPLTVADLAAHAHVGVTTLHRRFRAEVGSTPLAWLTGRRVLLAERLLERDDLPLDLVAQRSGLGTTANLRVLIRRHTGSTPSTVRARFRAAVPAR
ncbi:AraC family transcriptional regulator [Curtobacterium sp. MCBD17_013]|uniref:GlxA family transcriptional regulator n=1 Tax=Curtobacterium sp. MCBD17_013 TaxID=2175668 RepID=UPI000DA8B083|nr:helix-turn-helix domain-containing protein [Curtobacterium sp. MCBD17_013]PZF63074.1 AraC family transcriptional regulator [Curtobacterium sp. MCBD17_013]